MDIVEFAERFMNIELQEWQKEHIRVLEKLPPDTDIRIVMGRHGQVYTYLCPRTLKELTQNG